MSLGRPAPAVNRASVRGRGENERAKVLHLQIYVWRRRRHIHNPPHLTDFLNRGGGSRGGTQSQSVCVGELPKKTKKNKKTVKDIKAPSSYAGTAVRGTVKQQVLYRSPAVCNHGIFFLCSGEHARTTVMPETRSKAPWEITDKEWRRNGRV